MTRELDAAVVAALVEEGAALGWDARVDPRIYVIDGKPSFRLESHRALPCGAPFAYSEYIKAKHMSVRAVGPYLWHAAQLAYDREPCPS